MEEVKNRFEEILCHGLMFVLHLALVLGGLGFASVFVVYAFPLPLQIQLVGLACSFWMLVALRAAARKGG